MRRPDVATTEQRRLTGWGRTAATTARVAGADDPARLLAHAGDRGVLARGLGRSYGDAAQNAGGLVLDMTSDARIHAVDVDGATLDADAGVSLDTVLRTVLPLGLTVPVLPGTRQVTLGGAVACDVHGKNHHVDGSFGQHVASLDLLTADGQVRTLGPDDPLFRATVGGLGLTGVVLRVRLRLRRVRSSYVVSEEVRAPDLDAVMDRLSDQDAHHRYSVAWFDSISRGRARGRGVVMLGRDADPDDLSPRQARRPFALPAPRSLTVPDALPSGLVNGLSGRAFNEVWFRRAPRTPRSSVVPAFAFFHPLDSVAEWNRLYGRRGLCQYQLAVPFGAEAVVHAVVARISATGHVSCLNVLKRFGPSGSGLLSFPMPGWTLAVDLPVRPGLERLLRELDALVLSAGGRVYLAKDSRTDAATLARMYPRLEEFRAVRDEVDPDGLFVSDLARRLRLTHPRPTTSEVA